MARDHARLSSPIRDEGSDFLALRSIEQHAYFVLASHDRAVPL